MKEEKSFSFKRAFSGFFFGAFIGAFYFFNFFIYADAPKIIFAAIVLICAVLGSIWSSFDKIKKKFSLGASFIGICIGYFVGFSFSSAYEEKFEDAAFITFELISGYVFMTLGFFLLGFLLRKFSFMKDAHDILWRRPDEWGKERKE